MGPLRPDDRLLVADDGVGELREQQRAWFARHPSARRRGRCSSARRRRSCPGRGAARRARRPRAGSRRRPRASPPDGGSRRASRGRGPSPSGSRRTAGSPARRRGGPCLRPPHPDMRRGAWRVSSISSRSVPRSRPGRSVRRALGTAVGAGVALGTAVGAADAAGAALTSGLRARDRALLLRVGPLAPLVVEVEDLGLVECVEEQDATPDDRLERRGHLVESGDDRRELALRDVADRTVREAVVERAQLGLALGRRAGAVAAVEDDDGAVLEVVDPALGQDGVARAVEPGGDRAAVPGRL